METATQQGITQGELRTLATSVAGSPGADGRSSSDTAVKLWQELVGGRWLVFDHFVDGGRQYIVLRRCSETRGRCRGLSPREREVAGGVVLGLSNKMIAYRLEITETTVATHLRRALAKLGIGSRLELIRLVPKYAVEMPSYHTGTPGESARHQAVD